ncbi:hypothetical protein O181_047560 [Austropuccinia psidii MF-1]|uniref:Uncharacterized protein n=1 Tax=Austropuccinia psidii MF-1 TaxID=1389203 RepID=A0A9Q3DVI3_9BASI|nr:hypothetical protein [Austropuccinia psidii MF-1]
MFDLLTLTPPHVEQSLLSCITALPYSSGPPETIHQTIGNTTVAIFLWKQLERLREAEGERDEKFLSFQGLSGLQAKTTTAIIRQRLQAMSMAFMPPQATSNDRLQSRCSGLSTFSHNIPHLTVFKASGTNLLRQCECVAKLKARKTCPKIVSPPTTGNPFQRHPAPLTFLPQQDHSRPQGEPNVATKNLLDKSSFTTDTVQPSSSKIRAVPDLAIRLQQYSLPPNTFQHHNIINPQMPMASPLPFENLFVAYGGQDCFRQCKSPIFLSLNFACVSDEEIDYLKLILRILSHKNCGILDQDTNFAQSLELEAQQLVTQPMGKKGMAAFDHSNQFKLQFSTSDGLPHQNAAESSNRQGRKREWSAFQNNQSGRMGFVDENRYQNDVGAIAEELLRSAFVQNSKRNFEPFTFYPHDKVSAMLATIPIKHRGMESKEKWVNDLVGSIQCLTTWKSFLEDLKLSNPAEQNNRLYTLANFLWELHARTLNVLGVAAHHDAFGIEETALKEWLVKEVGKILSPATLQEENTILDQECFKKFFSGPTFSKRKPRLWRVSTDKLEDHLSDHSQRQKIELVNELALTKTKVVINILGSYYKFHNDIKWQLKFQSDSNFFERTLMYARHKTYIHIGGWGEPKRTNYNLLSFFPWASEHLPSSLKRWVSRKPEPLPINDLVLEVDED